MKIKNICPYLGGVCVKSRCLAFSTRSSHQPNSSPLEWDYCSVLDTQLEKVRGSKPTKISDLGENSE